jgi:hypothetical protein
VRLKRTRVPQSPPAPLRDFATSCFSAGGTGRLVLACQSICSSIGPCVSSPFGMARDCRSRAFVAAVWGRSATRSLMDDGSATGLKGSRSVEPLHLIVAIA